MRFPRIPALLLCTFLPVGTLLLAVDTKVWEHAEQADFEKGTLTKLSLSSDGRLTTAPVLRTFDPARRAVLTTDASEVAVAAVLTQPDDDGHQREQGQHHETGQLLAQAAAPAAGRRPMRLIAAGMAAIVLVSAYCSTRGLATSRNRSLSVRSRRLELRPNKPGTATR